MELHLTQKEVAKDNSDYRVVCCGRQWGKTTLAVMEMVACAYSKNGREVAYFATTFDQARNIAWAMLKEFARGAFSRAPNESRLECFLKTQDGGESRITLRGFESVETARGQQFDLLVIDEVAFMRNWDYAWGQLLEPTLAFRKGKSLFISTPLFYNHFKKMYDMGLSGNPNWKSWRFTSYDNPHLDKEWIDKRKAERTPEAFATEYLADFKQFYGLVYKDFERETHVIQPFDIPENWSVYRGLDFGSTNPTACLWVTVDGDDNWFIVDEHYEVGKTIDYHSGVINSNKLNSRISASYGDPSGAQYIQEFAQRGIYITPANKETGQNQQGWVRFKIEKISEKLRIMPGKTVPQLGVATGGEAGSPGLFVFSTCTNVIKEFETYRWKEKAVSQAQDLNEPDAPEKANDHAMDALSYFAVSYKKQDDNWDNINEGLRDKWRI